MATLSSEQLDELQGFIKDWLRHAGRTQSDLRRALQASSIRMPVLLDVLQRTYGTEGLSGLAAQLCGIEDLWQGEDGWQPVSEAPSLDDSLGQLDMLLREIRMDQDD
jgi:hypothetical protein